MTARVRAAPGPSTCTMPRFDLQLNYTRENTFCILPYTYAHYRDVL